MTPTSPPPRIVPHVDGQSINVASPVGAVAAVRERMAAGRGFTFFTLNLDHLVKLRSHPGFRAAYRAASLVSADGWPVALLARRGAAAAPGSDSSGTDLEVTTGADLVVPLCAMAAADGVPVYLFGATQGSLAGAAASLRATHPGLDIRGWHAPPYGFDPHGPEADADADRIAASGARLVFVALGAPKQELFAARAAARHPGLGLVCIGAALDFLSGMQVRAPRAVRAARLEWLWRLAHAPKALGARYARCAALLADLAVVAPALRAVGLRGRSRAGAPGRYRICLMYTMDPRGAKVGGIETHIRLILRHHPADVSVLFIGIDEAGDCTLGQVRTLTLEGRTIDFLPVARIEARDVNHAAKRLTQSITLHYVLGALRHLGAIRRALGPGPATADLHRFEFAPLARLLGLPAFQMVHGEGSRDDQMDSLIKSYWYLHSLGERLALRWATGIFCVNPAIVKRIAAEFPRELPKAEVLTVSVDTGLFSARPFACADGVFRIVFAGRLDAFKDPPLIFATIAALRTRLGGKVELHYVGASDPTRFPEFAAVRDVTVLHGFQDAAGVARVMALCHAGILASFFEGMPCFLLEGLASGRPFGAIRLPQFDGLIEAGVSGFLVERADSTEASADLLAEHFARLWDEIREGRLDPWAIHAKAAPYAVTAQMSRLFARHRAVQEQAGAPAPSVTAA